MSKIFQNPLLVSKENFLNYVYDIQRFVFLCWFQNFWRKKLNFIWRGRAKATLHFNEVYIELRRLRVSGWSRVKEAQGKSQVSCSCFMSRRVVETHCSKEQWRHTHCLMNFITCTFLCFFFTLSLKILKAAPDTTAVFMYRISKSLSKSPESGYPTGYKMRYRISNMSCRISGPTFICV
jgi:hypothetical protein